MRGRDIILLTETHESPERGLPRIHGFQWESLHRGCTRQHTSRGSGGVAILFRQKFDSRLQIVARDPQARYMWIRLELSRDRTIYIALVLLCPLGVQICFYRSGVTFDGGLTICIPLRGDHGVLYTWGSFPHGRLQRAHK